MVARYKFYLFWGLFQMICILPVISQAAQWQIIHAGHLLHMDPDKADARSFEFRARKSVVIRNGKISKIHDGYTSPKDLQVSENDHVSLIDLSNRYVLPGLIDGHIHLTATPVIAGKRRIEAVTLSDADRAVLATAAAKAILKGGFTTVRDLGAIGKDAIYAVRDGIKKRYIPGPNILASGNVLSPTGGHADKSTGYRQDLHNVLTSPGVCNGQDGCTRVVREQIRNGANAIKITATGGVLSQASSGVGQQFTDREMIAIVETAHALGRKVTAHAHSKQGIEAALKAGVDSVEHGTFLDQKTIKLFLKNDAYLVPTLMAGDAVTGWAKDDVPFLSIIQKSKALLIGDQMIKATALAHKAGVKIAFGTDSSLLKNGINCREFPLLVKAGLSPQAALHTSLINAAENLGIGDHTGRLLPEYHADIIAVRKDPFKDINALCDVTFVMKSGHVEWPEK